MRTLDKVKVGERGIIVRIRGAGPVKRRIMDMGLTKGVELFVEKVAPLGDPIELKVRGYALSMRKEDAGKVDVE